MICAHRGELRARERTAPALRDPRLHQDHERRSGRDRGQEEGDGKHGRPPRRRELVRHEEEERAERALVHGRERHGRDREHDRLAPAARLPEDPGQGPEDDGGAGRVREVAREHEDEERHRDRDVDARPALPGLHRPREPPPLERDRQELEEKDRHVEADAPRDLEHGRLLGGIHAERIEVPRQAEVGDERHRDEGVAQEAHEHGSPAEGIQVLPLEDVDEAGGRERSGGHGDPDEVEDDPEPPGIRVREMRAARRGPR